MSAAAYGRRLSDSGEAFEVERGKAAAAVREVSVELERHGLVDPLASGG